MSAPVISRLPKNRRHRARAQVVATHARHLEPDSTIAFGYGTCSLRWCREYAATIPWARSSHLRKYPAAMVNFHRRKRVHARRRIETVMHTNFETRVERSAETALWDRRLNHIGWGILLMFTGSVWLLLPAAHAPSDVIENAMAAAARAPRRRLLLTAAATP